ncbi:MAG: hypothetical protein ACOYMG_21225, partial [Candidatus Methylumidiphilus sp.]
MKRPKDQLLLLLIAVISLSSCATMRELIYGRPNQLAPLTGSTLGSTQRDEIVQRFGAPDEID